MNSRGNPPLERLLRDVSRSFHLTLRVLPSAVRSQVGLAYLLARATDTIADTELVPVADRLAALDQLRGRILGGRTDRLDFEHLAAVHDPNASPAEKLLLRRIEEPLALLGGFEAADQQKIRDVLDTITSGQELDLRRFGGTAGDTSRGVPRALATEAELDDYTYRVAGCVGEFWTKICRAHLFPETSLDEPALVRDGIRFGKGLQLVNILRDLPKDLRAGRCYIPADRLSEIGLVPADLLSPSTWDRIRPLYNRYLEQAGAHLAAGWAYTNTLPRRQMRLRLACAWPILIGLETLLKLREGNVLDPAQRVKVGRGTVRNILLGSILSHPWPGLWQRLFERRANWLRSGPNP